MKNIVIAGLVVVALGAAGWFVYTLQKTTRTNVPVSLIKEETPMPSPQPTPTAAPGKTYADVPPVTIDTDKTYTATMGTSKGTMTLTLFAKETPVTVNNFVFLARAGFYDNTVFHRIIRGFMIQGGDPKGDGTGGPGYTLTENPSDKTAYTRGTIAMAKKSNEPPGTQGSQFFIMHQNGNLPKDIVYVGAIDASDSASLTTLDAIATVPVGQSSSGEESRPLTSVTLTSVTIEEK